MKKASLLAGIIVSIFSLVSASVWEGAVGIDPGLPENGLATNSFPVNTIVEVINLENNTSANLIVSSSLDNSGLLALISKEAADYIGLSNMGRIRMREKDNQVTYSGFGERSFFSGDPNYGTGGNTENESGEFITDLDGYDLAMVPAETRPPEGLYLPDPNYFIPPVSANTSENYAPPVINVIPPVSQSVVPVVPPSASANSATTEFSAPIIESFVKGMYYIQIGAYRTAQTVESEISKIEKNLPVALMKVESEDGPIYRILIGPLNLGESGAILQRYKAIYNDAFVRLGN
ncbi:MAG: SPOR domain-containing protein [Treponema sp.]|jgi:hypothetical protein|nr:SPOR domain-containing protein [Treponema sp.]